MLRVEQSDVLSLKKQMNVRFDQERENSYEGLQQYQTFRGQDGYENSNEMTKRIRLDETLSKNESKLMETERDESLFDVNISQLVTS